MQVREGKVKVHAYVQVQMREVAGSELFPIRTCIYGRFVRHFLIKTILQLVIQVIASAGTHHYIVVQLKNK